MYVQILSMEALETLVDRQDTNTAVTLILEERVKQLKKWGEQNHHPVKYLAILMEEMGELAIEADKLPDFPAEFNHSNRAIMRAGQMSKLVIDDGEDYDLSKSTSLLTEAIHTAAVALAIVEMLLRKGYTP